VHYDNPTVIVSCFIAHERTVLLCRRALAPAYGLWTPPSGFLETGETLEQGAARETLEEAGVEVDPQRLTLFGIKSMTELAQVHISFAGRVLSSGCVAGSEALEAAYFAAETLPWHCVAYPAIADDIRRFLSEL
jgi:ADP-ribose pyrophosphatase YjhB (NUDIX family)